MFPYLLRSLDVTNFEIEINIYDLENNIDLETFFNTFPEYRKYLQDSVKILLINFKLEAVSN
jgi:hypothetical protein